MNRLYPLKVGDFVEPEPRIIYLGDCDKTMLLGNFFFLIQGTNGSLLVDTGVTKSDADRFNASMVQQPADDPFAQLDKFGVSLESIEIVIATHLHWDHVSPAILAMPNARLYVDRREIDSVVNPPHPWFAKFVYTEVLDQLLRDNRIVYTRDGDDIAGGISVMSTPGHTLGGQSVVVQTARGNAVVTGDVCFTYRNLEEDRPVGFNCGLVDCFASLERIRRRADIVLPSHDLSVLERLPDGV